MSDWMVYMVECADRSLYTGITTDLTRRLDEHNSSNSRTRYTRTRQPVRLVYREYAASRAMACKREFRIKRLSAMDKRQLISHFRET